nr:MAG TPA: hypothetical protein [Bacteriophage sp.]
MWTEIVFCRKCRRFIFSQDNLRIVSYATCIDIETVF